MSIQLPTLTIQNVVPRSRVSIIWRVSDDAMNNEYYQLEAPDERYQRAEVVFPLPTYACDIDINVFHINYQPYAQRIWYEGEGSAPVVITINQEDENNYEYEPQLHRPQVIRPGSPIEFNPPDKIKRMIQAGKTESEEMREIYLEAIRGYDKLSTYVDDGTIPLNEGIARRAREVLEETVNGRQAMVDRLLTEHKNEMEKRQDDNLEPIKNIHKRLLDI